MFVIRRLLSRHLWLNYYYDVYEWFDSTRWCELEMPCSICRVVITGDTAASVEFETLRQFIRGIPMNETSEAPLFFSGKNTQYNHLEIDHTHSHLTLFLVYSRSTSSLIAACQFAVAHTAEADELGMRAGVLFERHALDRIVCCC